MRQVVLLSTLTLLFVHAFAQKPKTPQAKTTVKQPVTANLSKGYNIRLTLTPLKNEWVYLYNYFGKNYQVADSAMLGANSEAIFRGNNKLPGGIYILVRSSRQRMFDVLMDEEQHFSIKADTLNPDNPIITGSKENDLYSEYTKFLTAKVPQINGLQSQLKAASSKEDSTRIRAALVKANDEMNAYRDNIIKNNPTSMLAAFFNTMKKPEVPPVPLVKGVPDSTYPGRFMKEHYWDDVDFADDRLLRTPFFDPKLEEYFKYFVSPEPDSIIPEVNYMLLASRESKDMFKYLLGRFTDKYINPEIMGQDKVFIFLFNNYFSKGDTGWLTRKQNEYIFNRAYSLMANQIGVQAPVLELQDTSNRPSSLYSLNGPFTFIFFWDPNCGHCKEMAPRVDSIYKASWKGLGVQVYAVNIDPKAIPAWKSYISEHKLTGWHHAYQTEEQRKAESAANQANFRQLYDVSQTPTMYLLDKEKRIVAKKLSLEQFNDLIQHKLKKPATNPKG